MLELLFALAGLVTGSLLNLCTDLLPRVSSPEDNYVLRPSCNRIRGPYELLPIMSYLWWRRRCPHRGRWIALRRLLVELVAALLFALLAWRFGLGRHLGVYLIYACVMLVVFVVDLEHQLVLNVVTYPAMAVAFGFSWLLPEVGPVSSALGGVFGAVTLSLPLIVYRRGIGLGDVKLGALIGLMMGWPVVAFVLLGSVLVAAAVAAFLMALRKRRRTDVMPFAPFLAALTVLAFFWGETVSRWSLGHLP